MTTTEKQLEELHLSVSNLEAAYKEAIQDKPFFKAKLIYLELKKLRRALDIYLLESFTDTPDDSLNPIGFDCESFLKEQHELSECLNKRFDKAISDFNHKMMDLPNLEQTFKLAKKSD